VATGQKTIGAPPSSAAHVSEAASSAAVPAESPSAKPRPPAGGLAEKPPF
jgi:hypothetical protein